MRYIHNVRTGQAIVIILMVCMVLGILAGAIINFQRGQINLLSKSAKDFLALCTAEAGLNCVLAEMRANYQFVTHGNPYMPIDDWSSPSSHRPFLVGETEGLELDHSSKGTYSGRVVMKRTKIVGDFKVRVKLAASKNSLDTKTIDEAHHYFILEAIGRIDDSYRKITAVIEKHVPASYLLYDAQVLDTGGYGPYLITPGILKRGRLYGHDMLQISKRGMFDAGTDFIDMEKISTPGYLKILHGAHLRMSNGREGRLKQGSDSGNYEKFDTFPEKAGANILGHFVLDGNHGGKPVKFPPLNPDYYYNAKRPKPVILTPGCGYDGFNESLWRNPAKPDEVVYDLNFGWKFRNNKDKVLLYSKVPLRIWGCPPSKATTIFCEQDVYIAGDFNANPKTPQNYDITYTDYSDDPVNGTDKNGVMVLSMGRIWFDYSQPILFLRNEMQTVMDYEIGLALGGEDLKPIVLAPIVYPMKLGTNSFENRLPMTSLNFQTIAALSMLPKEPPEIIPVTMAALLAHPSMRAIREYFEPSTDPEVSKTRFAIRSFTKRNAELAKLAAACYMLGTLLPGSRDGFINAMLNQAEKEVMEGDPDTGLGAWNMFDRIFKLAITHPKTRFKMPEMTVNALLIDSGELNARWAPGDGEGKVLNELGNIESREMRSFQYGDKESKLIIRHLGGKIHLRSHPARPFLDGSLRNDSIIVRRNVWDNTFVRGGGDYFPPYHPAAFSIASWKDSVSDAETFDSF